MRECRDQRVGYCNSLVNSWMTDPRLRSKPGFASDKKGFKQIVATAATFLLSGAVVSGLTKSSSFELFEAHGRPKLKKWWLNICYAIFQTVVWRKLEQVTLKWCPEKGYVLFQPEGVKRQPQRRWESHVCGVLGLLRPEGPLDWQSLNLRLGSKCSSRITPDLNDEWFRSNMDFANTLLKAHHEFYRALWFGGRTELNNCAKEWVRECLKRCQVHQNSLMSAISILDAVPYLEAETDLRVVTYSDGYVTVQIKHPSAHRDNEKPRAALESRESYMVFNSPLERYETTAVPADPDSTAVPADPELHTIISRDYLMRSGTVPRKILSVNPFTNDLPHSTVPAIIGYLSGQFKKDLPDLLNEHPDLKKSYAFSFIFRPSFHPEDLILVRCSRDESKFTDSCNYVKRVSFVESLNWNKPRIVATASKRIVNRRGSKPEEAGNSTTRYRVGSVADRKRRIAKPIASSDPKKPRLAASTSEKKFHTLFDYTRQLAVALGINCPTLDSQKLPSSENYEQLRRKNPLSTAPSSSGLQRSRTYDQDVFWCRDMSVPPLERRAFDNGAVEYVLYDSNPECAPEHSGSESWRHGLTRSKIDLLRSYIDLSVSRRRPPDPKGTKQNKEGAQRHSYNMATRAYSREDTSAPSAISTGPQSYFTKGTVVCNERKDECSRLDKPSSEAQPAHPVYKAVMIQPERRMYTERESMVHELSQEEQGAVAEKIVHQDYQALCQFVHSALPPSKLPTVSPYESDVTGPYYCGTVMCSNCPHIERKIK